MVIAHFCTAVRAVVRDWMGAQSEPQIREALENPVALGAQLLPVIQAKLSAAGATTLAEVLEHAWTAPALHLRSVFEPGALPPTPEDFTPVPVCPGTAVAMVTAIAALAALNSATISYGSENDGHLFVNLVVIPGEGDIPQKSTRGMQGHTDGVSFPLRGYRDPDDARIAPSPDFVGLCCLRNPEGVPTTVMPLSAVLEEMPAHLVQELREPNYVIGSQRTFEEGMIEILGDELTLDEARLLFRVGDAEWIRFSHRTTDPVDKESSAQKAMDAFQDACRNCVQDIALSPGDIVLVNNRIALHGRSPVGTAYGGETRWLLRTYGLDTTELAAEQRYLGSPFKLFP
ncbi:TauD/TfdA family dioxygenase [Pseudomonas shirazensis]|uniref:TauD/TfdA family dioxygenase n=1 Tax=Pseudomonas shirazensis TaxID=2745494 RepID=UPI00398594DB